MLIPKSRQARLVSNYRSISLCNVSYKIVTKVIANRMKFILNDIIDECQSAFISGRFISDNMIIGQETLHFLQHKRKGKKGFIALKLDMSKAYDCVEWSYLSQVLRKLGFHEDWINLIMDCISTASFSILINGEAVGIIKPSRGLRQGDSLSPYLFLLCTEGLSAMLASACSHSLTGVAIARSCPSITHLFFADDSLIFLRATMEKFGIFRNIMETYEKASG